MFFKMLPSLRIVCTSHLTPRSYPLLHPTRFCAQVVRTSPSYSAAVFPLRLPGWSTPWCYSPSAELFPKHRCHTTVGFCTNSLRRLCIHMHRAPQVHGTERATPLYELSEWRWTNAATLKTAEGKLEVRLIVQKDKKYPYSYKNSQLHTEVTACKGPWHVNTWVAVQESLISGQRPPHTLQEVMDHSLFLNQVVKQ